MFHVNDNDKMEYRIFIVTYKIKLNLETASSWTNKVNEKLKGEKKLTDFKLFTRHSTVWCGKKYIEFLANFQYPLLFISSHIRVESSHLLTRLKEEDRNWKFYSKNETKRKEWNPSSIINNCINCWSFLSSRSPGFRFQK